VSDQKVEGAASPDRIPRPGHFEQRRPFMATQDTKGTVCPECGEEVAPGDFEYHQSIHDGVALFLNK
jgi:hypothetical protein